MPLLHQYDNCLICFSFLNLKFLDPVNLFEIRHRNFAKLGALLFNLSTECSSPLCYTH